MSENVTAPSKASGFCREAALNQQNRLVRSVYSPADVVLGRICAFVGEECGEYSSEFALNENHADSEFLQFLRTANWSSRAQRCHNVIQMFSQAAVLFLHLYQRMICSSQSGSTDADCYQWGEEKRTGGGSARSVNPADCVR